MASTAPIRSAPPEIEHLFQTSLFLMLVVGFATLASTGKLDLLSVGFVLASLALRGYLLLREIQFVIPRRVTYWLSLVYVAMFFADFFFFSGRDFVPPAVHLVLFGMCIKLFSIERERDYIYLAVLAFLMVLAAAVLTVDSAFFAAFALFIVLAVFCFMLMEMRRSARSATNAGALAIPGKRTRRRSISPLQRLAASLARTTAAMVVAILSTAVVLFFALPRISGGYLSRHAQSDLISTGFSDSVNLGEIGHIQQSSEIVAHIRIDGDSAGLHEIRLRGSVLTNFDGKRWTNHREESTLLAQSFGRIFQLSSRSGELDQREEFRMARGASVERLHYRVLMEPLSTSVIFTIPVAQALFGRFREIGIDDDQSFRNLDRERSVTFYEGVSDLSAPTTADFDHLADARPVRMPPRYLQLPEKLDPRVPELARQITAAQRSPYRQAAAIERYLMTHYSYTLDLPSQAQPDPLAQFLFTRKRGHCEYFASSMAVLLRSNGIPSRVITGFRGGQFNQVNGTYIVRARDAHSWVEAYIPGAGWTSFDPTPSAAAVVESPWTRLQLYLDAAREFWREWVVNYDAAHQQALSINSVQHTRRSLIDLRSWAAQQYQKMLDAARRLHRTATESPQRLLRPAVFLAALTLVCLLPALLWQIWQRRRAASPKNSPATASAIFYLRLTRQLARHGYPRELSQTATELGETITEPELREAVLRFGAAYERARFGGSGKDAETLPELLHLVRQQLRR